MAVSVKRITLWRGDIANTPGSMANVLAGLASSDLQVVMGYRMGERAIAEIYPVSGKKAAAAAQGAGLAASGIPTLLVLGDNRPGLGHAMAREIASAGINMIFLVAQVVGRKYSAVLGFDSEADADRAAKLVKKAAASKKK